MLRTMCGWVAIACVGCGGGGGGGGDDTSDPPDPHKLIVELPATASRDLDVLFVIDDSPSTADKQANLANNFPNFINVLDTAPGGLPDLHLGVVTSDMGTKGSDVASPGPQIGQVGTGGCAGSGKAGLLQTFGAPVTGAFIVDLKQTNGTRTDNYMGNLDAVFGQMVRGAGSGGCGFEQPLAAMRAALQNTGANAGFLRPGAMLAVVLVTDEDDCSFKDPAMLGPESATLGPLASFRCTKFGVTCASGGTSPDAMTQIGTKSGCRAATDSPYMTDVASFRTFLVDLKGDARRVAVAGIMGTSTPFSVELHSPPGGGTAVAALGHSCTYSSPQGLEAADPPARLVDFLDRFPEASSSSSICQPDLSGGLVSIGELLTRKIGSPCITAMLADTDPAVGIQPDCRVEDVVGTTRTVVPACGATPVAPCWRFEADLMNCPVDEHQKLIVERSTALDPATVTELRCLLL